MQFGLGLFDLSAVYFGGDLVHSRALRREVHCLNQISVNKTGDSLAEFLGFLISGRRYSCSNANH